MTEVMMQQEVSESVMDDIAFRTNMDIPYMDDDSSAETPSSTGERGAPESNESSPIFLLRLLAIFSCCSADNKSVTVSRVAGNVTNAIDEFLLGMRQFYKNILGTELHADTEEWFRQLFSDWNTFLQQVQGNTYISVATMFCSETVCRCHMARHVLLCT